MENKEQKSKRQLKIERTGWDAKHDYWHITTCILGHLNTFPEHEKTIFSSYDELYTAFAKTQGVEYTNYEAFRAWLREGFLSKSNKIVRKSSNLKRFRMSDKQMEILFNDRPSKLWKKKMAKGRNQIVNGRPIEVPYLGVRSNKPSAKDKAWFLKKQAEKKARNRLLYAPSPESAAAKKCLFEYLKKKSGRTDGYTNIAILDFCAEKGYSIPEGMTTTDWLVQLYHSKADPDINEDGTCTEAAIIAQWRVDFIAQTKENERLALLESEIGKAMLEHYEDLAEQHGGDWYDHYNKGYLQSLGRPQVEPLTHKEKYNTYINSPEWKKFRLSIIIERGSVCEKCSAEGSVDAHHLTYDRLFNELPQDIMLLCKPCHKKEHGIA
jgi:hypothetical protein